MNQFRSEWYRDLGEAIRRRYPHEKVCVFGSAHSALISELGPDRVVMHVDDEPGDGAEPSKMARFLSGEKFEPESIIVAYQTLAESHDIWLFLHRLRQVVPLDSRVVFIEVPYLWHPLVSMVDRLRTGRISKPRSWLSRSDISNLLALSGFEIVAVEDRMLCPLPIPVLAPLLNRILVTLPVLRMLAMNHVYFVRPRPSWKRNAADLLEKVSVVVPCKDEKGNIERCVREVPLMGVSTEIIFVEGGSKDGTAEEIERVIRSYKGPLKLRSVTQEQADGKGGAVRLGFDAAEGDILMILDADLTVPPSELPKFYSALTEGEGELVMGSRLVYPLERDSMRTLNIFGNKFFSMIFSWLLHRPIKDTLCGTKVLRKNHYEKIRMSRARFGDFDPFGDFDLLFGAALLNLKIVEIPIRYQARTYGDTKISRFRHGFLLLRMCFYAFRFFRLR